MIAKDTSGKSMNILVTNDDGIESKGLWSLARAMSRVGQVTVIAPDTERSGVGSCLSLRTNISVTVFPSLISGVAAYAVGGTPGDCVMLGTRGMTSPKFDIVVSGINPGPNTGKDIHYSGTVMATLECYYQKIPAIAVSLYAKTRTEPMDFDLAAEFAENLAVQIKNGKLKTDAVINLNVPNIHRKDIKGIRTTRTARTGYVNPAKTGGSKSMNYTFEQDCEFTHGTVEGTDIKAVLSGYVSISFLRFEVNHDIDASITACLLGIESDFLKDAAKTRK
jgi:5'-nucleotidase